MGTLKAELVHHGEFPSYSDGQTELFDFIVSYYNKRRLHSSLNFRTPSRFDAELVLRQGANVGSGKILTFPVEHINYCASLGGRLKFTASA
jgi:hypothetical protein